MQAAYTAESLAVYVYSAIIANFDSFKHPKLQNKDYFEAALKNEKDHKAFLAEALGTKTPTGLTFTIPASVTKTGQSLLNTGVVLETAFVEAYLGAVETFSSLDLKVVAAKVAACEATHFSFFDAAAGAARRPTSAVTACCRRCRDRDDPGDRHEAEALPRLGRGVVAQLAQGTADVPGMAILLAHPRHIPGIRTRRTGAVARPASRARREPESLVRRSSRGFALERDVIGRRPPGFGASAALRRRQPHPRAQLARAVGSLLRARPAGCSRPTSPALGLAAGRLPARTRWTRGAV